MIILNNMYTGRYISKQGNLGHESINLNRTDDENFYIWLNSMGVCKKKECDMIMVRSINSKMYKVLAKANNCKLCPGANVSRKKKNKGIDDKEERYILQKKLNVTYNGKCPMDDIFNENDMFATFVTKTVYKPTKEIYLTNDTTLQNPEKDIYYADFSISESMRNYVESDEKQALLRALMDMDVWEEISNQDYQNISKPEINFFKIIRKEKDELAFSNILSYYIGVVGMDNFLSNCLNLENEFVGDNYQLLREKNNIDISFFGEEHIVIIENKIDAYITVNNRVSIDSQIKKAVDIYFDSQKVETEQMIKEIVYSYLEERKSAVSQLSKYYIYAIAYLLSKGVNKEEVMSRIKCFLLIPRYAKKQFDSDQNDCLKSEFAFSDKYKIITYESIYNYFDNIKEQINDNYIKDFLSALNTLKKEFNNELEEDMKYRFYHTIGKIQ